MSKNKILIKIQNFTGATVAELAVALVLFSGLTVGFVLDKYYFIENNPNKENISYFDILDSIAANQQAEYTGVQDEKININNKISNVSPAKEEIVFKQPKEKKSIGKININTASKLELMELPGVGEKTAIKIIQYRENKKFGSIEEIQNIKGIGPKKFENMKNYLQV